MQRAHTHAMSITSEPNNNPEHHDLQRSDTLLIYPPSKNDDCVSPSRTISDNQFTPIQRVESLQFQGSTHSLNVSYNNSFHSAFTPVRKRERDVETSPV